MIGTRSLAHSAFRPQIRQGTAAFALKLRSIQSLLHRSLLLCGKSTCAAGVGPKTSPAGPQLTIASLPLPTLSPAIFLAIVCCTTLCTTAGSRMCSLEWSLPTTEPGWSCEYPAATPDPSCLSLSMQLPPHVCLPLPQPRTHPLVPVFPPVTPLCVHVPSPPLHTAQCQPGRPQDLLRQRPQVG